MTTVTTDDIRTSYRDRGFAVVPGPVVERELIDRAAAAVPNVIRGEYSTGVPPTNRHWNPGDDPNQFVKIDQVHLCDHAMSELAGHAGVGEAAARATGADTIQLWASQMIVKPSAPGDGTALGWHQDDLYWHHNWDGEVFTCWIALSDVDMDCGPVTYVEGSHHWPVVEIGADFRDHDLDGMKGRLALPDDATWNEVSATLPRGGIAFHHKRTMHASRQNTSGRPRMGFILHLKTGEATPKSGAEELFSFDLDDTDRFPILYSR